MPEVVVASHQLPEQQPLGGLAHQLDLQRLDIAHAADERAHLIEVVRTRIDRNERIAILFPTNRHVFGYARALREAGLEVEVNQSARNKADALPAIDFSTPLPKLCRSRVPRA